MCSNSQTVTCVPHVHHCCAELRDQRNTRHANQTCDMRCMYWLSCNTRIVSLTANFRFRSFDPAVAHCSFADEHLQSGRSCHADCFAFFFTIAFFYCVFHVAIDKQSHSCHRDPLCKEVEVSYCLRSTVTQCDTETPVNLLSHPSTHILGHTFGCLSALCLLSAKCSVLLSEHEYPKQQLSASK